MSYDSWKATEPDDSVPRPEGCVCTWEAGDSPCPIHGMDEAMTTRQDTGAEPVAAGEVAAGEAESWAVVSIVTAESLTDRDIETLFAGLQPGDPFVVNCLDARFASPGFKRNRARDLVAAAINARNGAVP